MQQPVREHQAAHKKILDNFDTDLDLLGSILLHPSLLDYSSPNIMLLLKSDLSAVGSEQSIDDLTTLVAINAERNSLEGTAATSR
jgi:hypothetical protein